MESRDPVSVREGESGSGERNSESSNKRARSAAGRVILRARV